MKLDAVIKEYVGDFGRYQAFVVAVILSLRLPSAFHNLGYVFYAATPDHWCRFPRRYDVINMTEEQWKRFAIPLKDKDKMEYDKCSMYSWAADPNMAADDINRTLAEILDGTDAILNDTVPCDNWEYDTWTDVGSSLVTEWNMVCGRAWMKANVASVYVIGWVVGTSMSGCLSDMFGRRPVIVAEAILAALLGIALPFCNHYVAFLLVRLALSAVWNGLTMTLYPLGLEAVAVRFRSTLTAVFMVMWSVSYVIVVGVAFCLRTWFHFMITLACLAVVFLVPAPFVPESLKWLVAKGHKEKAEVVLRRAARWNKKSLPPHINLFFEKEKIKQRTSVVDLLRTPNIRLMTIILCFNWFLNALVYYNITWNADTLHGELYLNVLMSGLLEVPSYLLNAPLLQKLGRRWATCICTMAVGVLYLISIFVPGVAGTVLILSAKFFITMTFTTMWQYTCELYPTVARATAMGMANWFGRGGIFLASYMPLMGPVYSAVICAALGIIGAITILMLPETVQATLPVSVQEVEQRAKIRPREILGCSCAPPDDTSNTSSVDIDNNPLMCPVSQEDDSKRENGNSNSSKSETASPHHAHTNSEKNETANGQLLPPTSENSKAVV